ncbi:hypothetical protein L916_07215 [Phytophthora nicotianae]|uniref:Uncharacterized protein n=1 Tax=Phytophthora nicotianae TaxID=4792 RepID=W2J815_PHYNI|nr:hypothetical protein L916_07215 [Phytophthora nicotianae]
MITICDELEVLACYLDTHRTWSEDTSLLLHQVPTSRKDTEAQPLDHLYSYKRRKRMP